MNMFKKNSMTVAVAAGLAALGAAGTAQAVHVSPDGLGQVLVFPYYTVRAGHFTAISVVNTQGNTKAVKVRFLEGKNSREVLDFNLFLSPADVWTGAIVQTTAGAKLISNDNSCVTPADLFEETRFDGALNGLNDFKNYQYTGTNSDSSVFTTLDRTREGYFEVFEMGVIDDDAVDGNAIAGAAAVNITGYIKHNSAGVPANCLALNALDASPSNPATAAGPVFPNVGMTAMFPPRGGLMGRASIINATTGANFTLSPTVLDAWSNAVRYSFSGNTAPSLGNGAAPSISNVFTSAGVVTATWNTGVEAVSGALMRNTIYNEFILDAGTQSQTDWIVTFPTKNNLVATGAPGANSIAPSPFARNFENNTSVGSCDPYGFGVFNREEGPVATTIAFVPNPSPQPPGAAPLPGSTLCWEANVVPFQSSSLLGSNNSNALISALQTIVNGTTTTPGGRTTPSLRGSNNGPNGWFSMNFNGAAQGLTPVSATTAALGAAPAAMVQGRHNGLPVIGAMVHNYSASGVTSKYGGVIDHRYLRTITP
jgi:hypothetical protein